MHCIFKHLYRFILNNRCQPGYTARMNIIWWFKIVVDVWDFRGRIGLATGPRKPWGCGFKSRRSQYFFENFFSSFRVSIVVLITFCSIYMLTGRNYSQCNYNGNLIARQIYCQCVFPQFYTLLNKGLNISIRC